MEEYKLMMYKYYLIGSLSSLKIKGVSKYIMDEKVMLSQENITKRAGPMGNTVLAEMFTSITAMWSDIVLTAAIEVQAKFIEESDLMTKHASDPDFWKSVNIE